MADPTQDDPSFPITEEPPKPPKKAAERIADLEVLLAESAAERKAQQELLLELAAKVERMTAARGAEDPQRAVDTTPAKQIGSIMIDDRMSEAEILAKLRAMREGKLAPDTAKRFRTDARIFPDRGSRLAAKFIGTTIPLREEVERGDFSSDSLAHHIAAGALVAIA